MDHYDHVISALTQGEVVPFLGAGVNLFGREESEDYDPGSYLPSGRELSTYLARKFRYDLPDQKDLLRVSQYGATVFGPAPLYKRLGEVFDVEYPINELHRFFAGLPSILRQYNQRAPYQLIITTNYDDVLEEAFREAKEPFDVVIYVARDPHKGKFRHIPYEALPRHGVALIRCGEIKKPNILLVRLRDGEDEASAYLKAQLAPEVASALTAYDGSSPSEDLISTLVNELNRLLCTRLCDAPPFSSIPLAIEARALVEQVVPDPNNLIRVNRFLLEEAFPHEIARSPRAYTPIEEPNTYRSLPFTNTKLKRTVILKIHGAVDRVADRNELPSEVLDVIEDSFVITEDDYINFLAHTDISKLVPMQLKSKLANSGFLFLGYGLRDWNLRVIMHRMWGEQKLGYTSWAIQKKAEELDKKLWGKRNVDIQEMQLEDYIVELKNRLRINFEVNDEIRSA
jgi:hypothetical protein